MLKKDLLSIKNLTKVDISAIFYLAAALKSDKASDQPLKNKTLALIFQKPSNRTRVSFEVGMAQLGGQAIYLGPDELKLGVRETVSDVARVLSRYVDGIVARTFKHQDIVELASASTKPVINGLTDLLHPCQALSDLFTIKEKFNNFSGVKLAFIGDGNNVLRSLLYGAGIVGLDMAVVNPKGYALAPGFKKEISAIAEESGSHITYASDPESAAKGADIIYTDVWVSMGQESEKGSRIKAFKGFQVNKKLVAKAKKDCKIMHCMPAHRGEEITSDVLDSPDSIVLDQAENRLHVQKAILHILLTAKK